MIFCLPLPCDLWLLPWPVKRSSLCSSCGHCHCRTRSLPFIVSTRDTGDHLAPGGQPCHHHTHMCAMLWFMLSAQLCVQIWLCAGLSSFLDSSSVTQDAKPVIHIAPYDSSLRSHLFSHPVFLTIYFLHDYLCYISAVVLYDFNTPTAITHISGASCYNIDIRQSQVIISTSQPGKAWSDI